MGCEVTFLGLASPVPDESAQSFRLMERLAATLFVLPACARPGRLDLPLSPIPQYHPPMPPSLSKTAYVKGLQCPLLLWTYLNRRQDLPPTSPATQALFDLGHEIGRLAQSLWSGGREVPMDWRNLAATEDTTRRFMEQGIPVFEASFLVDRRYCRVDILEPAPGGAWNLMEVKATTSVKDVHLDDVAFQADALRRAGVRLHRLFLLHIDNRYVRHGAIDPHGLLVKEDVTDRVAAREGGVASRVEELLAVIDGPAPRVPIGEHCLEPYECPLKERCWSFLPEHHPLQLYRVRKREAFRHIHAGVRAIVDLPPSGLNEKQRIQQEAIVSGRPHVDAPALRRWLAGLSYPLHHLDFETINPGIPLFDGTRPFQRIPFQFSLHMQESPGTPARHLEFLETEARDPRPALIEALAAIGPKGSLLAYNMGFERGVLEELARDFPPRAAFLRDLAARLRDLLVPFRDFSLYHPAQMGSCSIKQVLPAFTPLRYDELDIHDGEQAFREYLRVVHGEASPDERRRVLDDLRRYCGLDTLAMVELLEVVRRFAG